MGHFCFNGIILSMINKDELIFADIFLKSKSFKIIYDWVIGDIRKCCRIKKDGTYKKGAGSLIGAYILWCCAVDYYGGLFLGVKKYRNWDKKIKRENYSTRQHIKSFVNKYLKKYDSYDPDKIYRLRNSLTHNYTLDGYTIVEHDPNKKTYHLKLTNKGYLLHLGCAIEDLEKAVKDYLKDLKKDSYLKIHAFEYYTLNPILGPLNPEDISI